MQVFAIMHLDYPETLLDAEIELMTSRRESLNAELKTLNQDKERKGKVLSGLGAEIEGQNSLKALLNKEMLEVLPLVDAGVLGSSERFRLEREEHQSKHSFRCSLKRLLKLSLEIEQVGQPDYNLFKSIIILKSIKNVLKSQVKLQN